LTNEEIAFMNLQMGDPSAFSADDFAASDSDSFAPSDGGGDDGMPPEIAAAFDEFIANQE
jgi:hypothetical protein